MKKYYAILLFVCISQSCKDTSSPEQNNESLLVSSLDPEFYREINGELRDVLLRNGYPIANIISVEFIISPTSSDDKNIRFLVRSIAESSALQFYRPSIIWEDGEAVPKDVKSVVSHNKMTEVEMLYELDKRAFDGKKDIYIKNNKNSKKNVILSALESRSLSSKFREKFSREGIFYVPINL